MIISRIVSRRFAALTLSTATLALVAQLLASWNAGLAYGSRRAPYNPEEGAVFNIATGTVAEQYRIVREVNKAIRASRKGSLVYISTFLLDNRGSADAIIDARNRGVGVQMVVDGSARNGVSYRIQRALNKDNRHIKKGRPKVDEDGVLRKWGPDRSFLKFCKGACRNGGLPNHSKFYVFTHTGAAHDVIMVSSSNLNAGGASKGYNDLMILKERRRLAEDFAWIHRDMARDSDKDYTGYKEFKNGSATARFFPKKTPGDPVMADLNKIRCMGAAGGSGINGRTAVNVSMFRWNNARGIALAQKLVKLDRAGCNVQVVYGAPGRKVVGILRTSARAGGIQLWDSRYDYDEDLAVDMRTHHKYLLINGHYGKDTSVWSVQTGSANWGQSLHAGDENTLTVESRKVYRQYIANFRWIVANAARRVA